MIKPEYDSNWIKKELEKRGDKKMSGGHYDYQYNRLNDLADDIERDFLNEGVVNSDFGEDGKYDFLSGATDEQRIIILKEVKNLIKDLRKCADRAEALEWYMSADYGVESYIEEIKHLWK